MKLEKKKALVGRTLGIGMERIIFNNQRLAEIKELITKQDVLDLLADGAIMIREPKGRKTLVRKSRRRRSGSVKMKPKKGKAEYVRKVRKLRNYLFQLRGKEEVTKEVYDKLRQEIRASMFKNQSHFKERVKELSK